MKLTKISATLGPTNTGKTFSAIEKLLSYPNGVIGFPLRLLARENFDFVKKEVGKNHVALVTGEEKIVPKEAKYFLCTVESIPDHSFDFVAIDEVQLCSDFERGHLFTEKILNTKGKKETMFLGSLSMEKILKKIYPDIIIKKKPRLSNLSYCGYKNLTRLPNRSAIIAFSLIDVYEIANKIRQAHGGVSVVMGALSPDVRNAQVKLFEEGKVDHIVATDAIGLGLNLNIKNIFFSSIKKFDGQRERKLTYDEISQIAGRAGRYLNNGFFGTTGDLKSLSQESVSFIENHEFTEIEKIYWRNSLLSFSSKKSLLNSINKKTNKSYLIQKKNASDQRFLKILVEDDFIKRYITDPLNLKKLWELCRTPDYSRELDEFHTRFLKKIFEFLVKQNNLIPASWVSENLKNIKKKTMKISELNHKISQIRKWSFLAFKGHWMENNNLLQQKIKAIEFDLSVILHSQLINEFVGEYKGLKSNFYEKVEKSIIEIDAVNSIKFGRKTIGKLEGFRFKINHSFKKNNIYNNKILKKYLIFFANQKIVEFKDSKYSNFEFKVSGEIFWKKNLVAKLFKNTEITKPKIKVFCDDFFLYHKKEIELKTKKCFEYFFLNNIGFIKKIDLMEKSSSNLRAVIFSLNENLGHCKKENLKDYYKSLKSDEIKILKQYGLKTGIFFLFFKTKGAKLFRQILINVFFENLLNNFLERNYYSLKKSTFSKKEKEIYRRMGFYLIKISKQNYLVYFEYLENLLKKQFYYKKKKLNTYIPQNHLEKMIFELNSKIIFLK
tara:strand:- start:3439 stop:5775 length:2337 start_codon:yes stop_codon:yes gene_type:complete